MPAGEERDGAVVVRSVAKLTVTGDHRAVDLGRGPDHDLLVRQLPAMAVVLAGILLVLWGSRPGA